MGFDETLVARIREVVRGRPDVIEKRMVGGRSFIVGGHLCCGVIGSDLMVRVGSAAHESTLNAPHVRPMQFAGRHLIGYVLVAPAGYESGAKLAAWVNRGIDYISTLPAKGPRH